LQLKPIANKSLASTLPSPGRELWLLFTSVVFLVTNMRAFADPVFAALLERFRVGACTEADIALINTRVLSADNVLDCSSCVVPVLVSSNRDRAAINRSSIAAAAAGGATVWRLPCVLTRARGAAVGLSDAVRNVVYAMPDSKGTSHLAPTLDLYIGMPVMVTHNICMQLGLANCCVSKRNIFYLNFERHFSKFLIFESFVVRSHNTRTQLISISIQQVAEQKRFRELRRKKFEKTFFRIIKQKKRFWKEKSFHVCRFNIGGGVAR
jgi:hypothetical protein